MSVTCEFSEGNADARFATPADTDTAATLAQDALVLGSVKRARDGAREVLNKAPRQREALVLMAETCRSPQDVAQTLLDAVQLGARRGSGEGQRRL